MIGQEKEAEIEKLETDFKAFVDGLQKQYSEASEKKDADTEVALLDAGFGICKILRVALEINLICSLETCQSVVPKFIYAKVSFLNTIYCKWLASETQAPDHACEHN